MAVQLQAGEQILQKAGANLYGFANSKGGELVLTNRRLVFQGHTFAAGTKIDIPLTDIVSCSIETVTSLAALLVPMKIVVVTLSNGTVHKFRVTKQDKWAQAILGAKAAV